MQSRHSSIIAVVNINRFKEGARVLEDIARFILEDIARFILKDSRLFDKIKQLKHRVEMTMSPLFTEQDIGDSTYIETNERNNLIDIVNANARRMQEAARTLEEVIDRHKFKKIRFISYDIHRQLLEKTKAFLALDRLQGIYPICDPDKYCIEKMASIINQTKVSICQLRIKSNNKKKVYQIAQHFKSLLNSETLLIINDHVDIALMCADGVHLGQDDLPVKKIRAITLDNFIIGVSCHDPQQARQAQRQGANYLSIGCLFPTVSKHETVSTSIETVTNILNETRLPVAVIGGINLSNLSRLYSLPINMFAIHGAIWNQPDPAQEIKHLMAIVNGNGA